MESIKEKLKIKWLLLIVIIVLFFLIMDTLYLLKLVDINNRLGGESLAYSIGYLFGFFIRPILDLTILYALLFKIKISDNK
jgi:hypothetical protein